MLDPTLPMIFALAFVLMLFSPSFIFAIVKKKLGRQLFLLNWVISFPAAIGTNWATLSLSSHWIGFLFIGGYTMFCYIIWPVVAMLLLPTLIVACLRPEFLRRTFILNYCILVPLSLCFSQAAILNDIDSPQ